MRLDYVSPLPPVRSGIADYSLDLLPELATRCDLRVIRLPGQPVSEGVVARWSLVAAERLGEGGRLPLYHMGNNLYHEPVLELALEVPGVVALHDLVLHHMLAGRSLGRAQFEPYREGLRGDHGWIGEAVALPPRWGGYGQAGFFALPAHRRLVRSQRGVLVHSTWAAEILDEEVAEVAVRVIPMAMPLGREVARHDVLEFRRRWGVPEGAPLLGSIGFQTPIKRTETVIRALARPTLEEVHLLVVGEVSEGVELEAVARGVGVWDRVHVTGFLPQEDFPEAIVATDLCVNLRYPTAGETSASLLRILALGRGTVVSDSGQFADLPGEVAVPVSPGAEEVEALASTLGELFADRQRLQAMGEAARTFIRERHDPAIAAAAILAACEELQDRPPPRQEPVAVPPPTTLTWGALPATLEVSGVEAPWREGELRQVRIRLVNTGVARWLAGEREEGGVVVEVQLLAGGRDLRAGRPWLSLPRDLPPGEGVILEVPVRRPPGPARLRVEPHVLGGFGFSALDGPSWEADI